MAPRRTILTSAQMGASAGAQPQSPDQAPPAAAAPPPAAVPAVIPTPDKSEPVNIHVSKQAGNQAPRSTGMTVNVGDLVKGLPAPELDLVPFSCRIPRALKEELEIRARLSGRRTQELVTRALVDKANPELLTEIYARLYGVDYDPQ